MYLRAPEGLPDELATLAEPLAVAVHAVGRSSAKLGDAVVVLGPARSDCSRFSASASADPAWSSSPSRSRAGGSSRSSSGPTSSWTPEPVSYTHLRAHETRHDLVCRLLLE